MASKKVMADRDARLVRVRELHAQGHGPAEIAREVGVASRSSISHDLAKMGIRSADSKLWNEVNHVTGGIVATCSRINELTAQIDDAGELEASVGEIQTCVRRLAQSLRCIRSLKEALIRKSK